MASYHLPEILRCTVLAAVAAEDDSAAAVAVGFAGAELGSGGVRRFHSPQHQILRREVAVDRELVLDVVFSVVNSDVSHGLECAERGTYLPSWVIGSRYDDDRHHLCPSPHNIQSINQTKDQWID